MCVSKAGKNFATVKVLLGAAAEVTADIAGTVRGTGDGDEETLRWARTLLSLSAALEKTCTGLELPSVLGDAAAGLKALPTALQRSNRILRAALGDSVEGEVVTGTSEEILGSAAAAAAQNEGGQGKQVEVEGGAGGGVTGSGPSQSNDTSVPGVTKAVAAKAAAPKMSWAKMQKPSAAVNFKDILSEQS